MKIKFYSFKFIKTIISNVFTNKFLIFFGLDNFLIKRINPYLSFKPSNDKSLQEIAGFSHRPEIDEVLLQNHKVLASTVQTYIPNGGKVLDIGCGPGLYLKDFGDKYVLYGQDISQSMIDIAKKELPRGNFINGNILDVELPRELDLIYCIGVLIYIPPSQLDKFFDKIFAHLNNGGILFLNYPHAISFFDLLYSDLTYVRYSPRKIEKIISKKFNILHHSHAVDNRVVNSYDKNPYKSLNPEVDKTYRNSYLLIAQKK
jgi:SAM-dependent methyltransferase